MLRRVATAERQYLSSERLAFRRVMADIFRNVVGGRNYQWHA